MKYYKWINLSRGIGIMLVVLGHAISDAFPAGSLFDKWLFQWIYSFHMPLFFFLSGFVSNKVVDMKGTSEKIEYIIKRAKRLLVPYFFVGFLYVFLKLAMSGIANMQVNSSSLINMFIGINPNYQLWTLYTLFFAGVLTSLIIYVGGTTPILAGVILWIMGQMVDIPILFAARLCDLYVFFAIGLYWRLHWQRMEIGPVVTVVFFVILGGLNIVDAYTGYEWLNLFTGIVGILMVAGVSMQLSKSGNYLFDTLGKYSMDIYIEANIVQVAVRTAFKSFIPPTTLCVMSTVLGLILPVIVSKNFIRKNKFLKVLVLGG